MVPHPDGSRKDSKDQFPNERTSQQSHGKDREVYKGLCVNCAKRCTCLFPRTEGGVWHCKEYVEAH